MQTSVKEKPVHGIDPPDHNTGQALPLPHICQVPAVHQSCCLKISEILLFSTILISFNVRLKIHKNFLKCETTLFFPL